MAGLTLQQLQGMGAKPVEGGQTAGQLGGTPITSSFTPSFDQSSAGLAQSQSVLDHVTNVAKGVAGAVGNTAIGAAKGALSTGMHLGEMTAKAGTHLPGAAGDFFQNKLTEGQQTMQNPALQPQGTAQNIGYGGEQVGEFFSPAGLEKGIATKAAPFIEGIPKALGMAGKLASGVVGGLKTGLKALTSGASMGAVTAAQTGGDTGAMGTNAAIGAASPFAALGLQGINSLAQKLPARLVQGALPKLDPSNIDKVLNETKLGSIDSLKAEATGKWRELSGQISSILNSEKYAKHFGNSNQAILDTVAAFPHSEYSPKDVVTAVKSVVPGFSKLVSKLENGFATLPEKNQLRQALDAATAKVFTDTPQVSGAKQIAAGLADSLRTEVQSIATETGPLFDDLSKEIDLRKALGATAKKMGNKKPVNLYSVMSALLGGAKGFAVGGPLGGVIGGVAAGATEELARSPGTAINAAKGIQAAGHLPNPAGLGAKFLGGMTSSSSNKANDQTNQ